MKGKILVIGGPTASGKSSLGIELALSKNGEIVSADSMQIYRRMDIGTAKVTKEEQSAVPHHMIDVAEPEENYSVARYVEQASACCDDILSRGRLPVVVGGTGLYIDSLLSGRDFSCEADAALREELGAYYDSVGGERMLAELARFDPDRAAILKANDKKRIVRAFEVYRGTGETITEHDRKTKLLPPRYEYDFIFLNPERSILYERIERRVDLMFEKGLVEEVRSLLSSGVPVSATSMQAIGYKETVEYINGAISLDEAVSSIKQGSRRYAKRQVTWFKKYDNN